MEMVVGFGPGQNIVMDMDGLALLKTSPLCLHTDIPIFCITAIFQQVMFVTIAIIRLVYAQTTYL